MIYIFLDKPEGARLTTNASQNAVTEGDSVTFNCTVKAAVPLVSIYKFFFNGHLLSITATVSILSIKSIDLSTMVSTNVSHIMMLEMEQKPL